MCTVQEITYRLSLSESMMMRKEAPDVCWWGGGGGYECFSQARRQAHSAQALDAQQAQPQPSP